MKGKNMIKINNILQLIRVKHWVKNILIFIPLACSGLINYNNVLNCIIAFFSFCFASSFIYVINDIKDIEKDRLHPTKRNRPLASGKIKKSTAICIAVLVLILSISTNTLINNNIFNISFYILISYIIINIFYSFGLKNVAIVDIILLASGFILRVYYGAAIINVEVSDWLFLTILSASLFLGLGKRKKELMTSEKSRKVLQEYNEAFLDKFQYVMLGLTLVFYSLWVIEQDIKYLTFTIPLIIVVFMRYCLIIEKSNEGDPTTIFYQDKPLILLCIIYGLAMILLLSIF